MFSIGVISHKASSPRQEHVCINYIAYIYIYIHVCFVYTVMHIHIFYLNLSSINKKKISKKKR